MKGGGFQRWYGNQSSVVNWHDDGAQIKADIVQRYPYLHGNWGLVVTNPNNYFMRGVTYSFLTSAAFSARLSPGGFIFDVAGSSLFPENISLILAVLNSQFAQYALKLINPTVNFQVGDLSRLPIPTDSTDLLECLVHRAISLAKADNAEDEATYGFTAPLPWECGLENAGERAVGLAEIQGQIDDEVYQLYGISPEDRAAIEAELSDGTVGDDEDDEGPSGEDENEVPEIDLTREELAVRWISYAVGIVLGRFQPGVEGALGSGIVSDEDRNARHLFAMEVESALRDLADEDGIVVLDPTHPENLAHRIEAALDLMLGGRGSHEVVTGIGGDLAKFLVRDFFTKWHLKWYRKRPVYWLLQSPKKSFGLYLFHERITPDTLFVVQRRYVDPKLVWLGHRITELRQLRDAADGRERRRLQKELDDSVAEQDDVTEFARRLERVTSRGYAPDLDDGVILNMAPLWEIVPSWSKEPKKYWDALQHGDYDWSHIAMRYWPERVEAKCVNDKSFAIAHGRLDLYREPVKA